MRFARAVLGRPYVFTIAILVANFFVFLLMWRAGGMTFRALMDFSGPVLIGFGAKLNLLIDRQPHQWWRFVTPIFLHGGLIHVLVNMYSLWMIGPYVEKLYGSARFVFFWVVTGICGVVASYLTVVQTVPPLGPFARFIFKTHDVPSVGASGAIFGLVGVLFVFGIKYRNELPEGFKRAFGTGLLPVIGLNLFIGFIGQRFIDNAAHLGGLISGAVLALVVSYRRPGESSRMTLVWRVLQVASIAIVVLSFVRVVQTYDPNLFAEPSRPAQNVSSLSFARAMNDGQETLALVLKGNEASLDQAIKELESVEGPDIKGDQLRRKLIALLTKARQQHPSPAAASSPGGPAKPDPLHSESEAFRAEYEDWLKTTGKNFLQL